MSIVYDEHGVTVDHGEALDVLREMPDSTFHAICTDPPYGLSEIRDTDVTEAISAWATGDREHIPERLKAGFMGREWDRFVPSPAVWDECLRVLKPGGHMLVFAGTRTVDLMGLSIRLAGFEIRDGITWLYGTGFPKSLDVSKMIDKRAGAGREVIGQKITGNAKQRTSRTGEFADGKHGGTQLVDVTAPATDAARQWAGWGTALKPASEPIIVARKPLSGTVAANVLEHGTGGINIDACRVEAVARPLLIGHGQDTAGKSTYGSGGPGGGSHAAGTTDLGRWPTNVVLVHSDTCGEQCADGGEVTLRVYERDRHVVSPESSLSHLLDQLRALIADLRRSSTNGTTLWPGACEFYRTEGTRSFELSAPDALLRGVERVLQLKGVPGSPAGCPSCRDSDGERVREVLAAGREGLPSLLGALERTTRQAIEGGCIQTGPRSGLQSSLDAPRRGKPVGRTVQSSTFSGSPHDASRGQSPRMSGMGELAPHRAELVDSSSESSSGGLPGSSETDLGSECTYATVRLLTLLAFDLTSRFVTPDGGVTGTSRVISLPKCPVAELDAQSGVLKCGDLKPYIGQNGRSGGIMGRKVERDHNYTRAGDSGGASRYFPTFRYQAKAPSGERPKVDGKAHPTVKPLALMRWLVRLVTPPAGMVLDPFAGSGTTGEAARLEGFKAVLIERDGHSIALIRARLTGHEGPSEQAEAPAPTSIPANPKPVSGQVDMFDLLNEGGAA